MDEIGVADPRKGLVFPQGLLPGLSLPVDELDGHLGAGEDLLTLPDHPEPTSPKLLQLDVPALEVSLPGGARLQKILKY